MHDELEARTEFSMLYELAMNYAVKFTLVNPVGC